MKAHLPVQRLALVVALIFTVTAPVAAQERFQGQTAPPPSTPGPEQTSVADSAGKPSTNASQAASVKASPGIAEILKMVDAKVSNGVIRLYVETSPVAYFLTAEDIIALKERGVADEIVTALLKRGAEVRGQASSMGGTATDQAGITAASGPAYGMLRAENSVLDPNSYAYFQTYYLHPRALASVYQRLGVYGSPYLHGYYPPFPSYSFGYTPQLGLAPLRGGTFQRYPLPLR
jgi:hypothetical protein